MSNSFTQLPGELNFTFVQGDQVRLTCDFNVNVTGYTITNAIYAKSILGTGGGSGSVTVAGSTVTSFVAAVADAADGTILLDLPPDRSSLLSPAIAHRWYLRWTDTNGFTRTILSGDVKAVSP